MTRDRHNGAHGMRANNVRPAASLVCAPLRSILGTSWRQPLPPQSSWQRSRHAGMSHLNEPWMCHEWDMSWMRRITYELVMVHMNASWYIWMSYGTYEWAMDMSWMRYVLNDMRHDAREWVMSYMNESWYIWISHFTYEWVMSHMNESWYIWMRHGTYEWVMSHVTRVMSWYIWMSHGTYEWIMAHMNESCQIWMSPGTYEWVMSHVTRVMSQTRSTATEFIITPPNKRQRRKQAWKR